MHSPDPAKRGSATLLMADDDEDDRILTAQALKACLINDIRFVVDGEDLMHYLRGEGVYSPGGGTPAPRPGLILLDLNMPKMNGHEALAEIKNDPHLRRIPVVALTTSKAEEDIVRSYDLGVNSFISKPVTFEGLAAVTQTLANYWFELVKLPEGDGNDEL